MYVAPILSMLLASTHAQHWRTACRLQILLLSCCTGMQDRALQEIEPGPTRLGAAQARLQPSPEPGSAAAQVPGAVDAPGPR